LIKKTFFKISVKKGLGWGVGGGGQNIVLTGMGVIIASLLFSKEKPREVVGAEGNNQLAITRISSEYS
jgi:hypothetical protein